jgi:NADH dehydrogenase FAD-containing subunit
VADAVISLPRLEGRRIAGIPHDPGGFVAVDEHGRVLGLEDVYAAGDVTSFPVKQRRIAIQQADAVAEALAAAAGAAVEPQPFDPGMQSVPSRYEDKTIGRYLGPLLDSLSAEAESTFRSTPAVRKTSHG